MLENNIYELTSSQKNIWDTEVFFSNSNLNNIGGYVLIKDKVNFALLEKALSLYAQKKWFFTFQIEIDKWYTLSICRRFF